MTSLSLMNLQKSYDNMLWGLLVPFAEAGRGGNAAQGPDVNGENRLVIFYCSLSPISHDTYSILFPYLCRSLYYQAPGTYILKVLWFQ